MENLCFKQLAFVSCFCAAVRILVLRRKDGEDEGRRDGTAQGVRPSEATPPRSFGFLFSKHAYPGAVCAGTGRLDSQLVLRTRDLILNSPSVSLHPFSRFAF